MDSPIVAPGEIVPSFLRAGKFSYICCVARADPARPNAIGPNLNTV
jgi:hypothetical protein